MNTPSHRYCGRVLTAIAAAGALTGCSTVSFDQTLAQLDQEASAFTQGQLMLATRQEQRSVQEQKASQLLAKPLTQGTAVQLALVNSPAMQALLAQSWADTASAAQLGRIVNPSFSIEQVTMADELEIGRRLTFGLLDLLTLPQRKGIADRSMARAQIKLTSDVIQQVTLVRQAWVRAVAARQSHVYALQVVEAAQASAELARRMQAVGNFSRLQQARQQSFYSDAAVQLASAQHEVTASTEALVRVLGLTDAQAQVLQLPDRLPELPHAPRSPDEVAKSVNEGRLDVKLAKSILDASAKAQVLNQLTSFTDIELGIRRDTVFDNAAGTQTSRQGYEVSVKLPLFDFGGMRRDAMNAQTLAAANQLEATVRAAGSHLRESYSAYRTAYDIAQHYRTEVLPLRQTIVDESVLRYNGMIIGVFELLAESRAQVSSVIAAIAAEQQFWLADAALQASQMGIPTAASIGAAQPKGNGGSDAGH